MLTEDEEGRKAVCLAHIDSNMAGEGRRYLKPDKNLVGRYFKTICGAYVKVLSMGDGETIKIKSYNLRELAYNKNDKIHVTKKLCAVCNIKELITEIPETEVLSEVV